MSHTYPEQFTYDDMVYPGQIASPEMLDRLKTFQFRSTDQLVVGYSKSGTSWTRYLLSMINNNGQEVPKKWTVWSNAPCIELNVGNSPEAYFDHLESLESPRVFCTHLRAHFFEKQVREGQCKVVFIIRNPKDVLVSYFHHHRMSAGLGMFKGDWNEFFELFKSNSLMAGSVVLQHVGWWKLRDLPNVLVVRYEDMKKDLNAGVRKLATFFGKDVSDEVLDSISKKSTFEKLKDNPAINNTKNQVQETNANDKPHEKLDFTISKFMRKGEIGDWKNYFTPSQNDYMDKLCEQLTAPIGLYYDYE